MNIFRLAWRSESARAAPLFRHGLILIAGLSLGFSGCSMFKSDPCKEPNMFQKLGRRLTHQDKNAPTYMSGAPGCEPGLIGSSDCGVMSGSPIINGSVDGIIGADAPPLDMSPVMTPGPVGNPPNPTSSLQSSNAAGSTTGKAVYETYRPRSTEATARRDPAPSTPPATPSAESAADPLANLPRLDPPAEFSPVPTEAEKIIDPSAAATQLQLETPPVPAEATSLAPGIRSFKVVEPRLAGGSLPADRGWTWLADQGYKTVLDLRPLDQLRSEDLAAINSSGLRYVVLPTADDLVDSPTHLARFAAEIGQDSARPLYFFDTNGSRAAVLWYLHQVVNLKTSADEAARNADEIGPRDPVLQKRAEGVVAKLKPVEPAPVVATPAAAPAAAPVAEPPAGPIPDVTTPPEKPAAPTGPTASIIPAKPVTPSRTDPTAWKPYVTLAAAGLGVPLALLGRNAITRAASPRASLPAPERSVRAIAASSGD